MGGIRVTDIQQLSVNDGRGIRATVFLAGCPLRCAWCCNPETWEASPDPGAFPVEGLRLLGREMPVEEIIAEAGRHSIFHRFSGGGVTWSGGEPFHRPRDLGRLVEAAASRGMHQAAETSGAFDWPACESILRSLDLVFLDLKHMDGEAHRRLTGLGNGAILENAARIGASGVETVARLPLVPGANDDERNISRTAAFVRENMRWKRMEILPFHDLGRGKYDALGLDDRFVGFARPSGADLERARGIAEREGVEIVSYR